MRVNFSERLILLIREVRQLQELGFRAQIPSEIMSVVENGKRYYKDALKLKQAANFFNSMLQQIIPAQQKMMVSIVAYFQSVMTGGQKA